MTDLLGVIATVAEAALAAYIGFYTLFLFVSVFFAGLYRLRRARGDRRETPAPPSSRVAVLLPAYCAGQHFLRVVDAVCAQDYPAGLVDVYVLAQRCPPEIVAATVARRVTVWERTFDDGTPGNPYLRALRWFVPEVVAEGTRRNRPYDMLVLADKDNILAPDFLRRVEAPFRRGAAVVQGVRLPLNLDTTAASLDYVAEVTNDQMLRAARAAMGLSAEISGSGIAFRPSVWLAALSATDLDSPVMDKTTLLELLKLGAKIEYCPSARLYEEKTRSFAAIGAQRTRWVGGQFYLARRHGLRAIRDGIVEGKADLVDFGLAMWRPPRAIHAVSLVVLAAASWVWPVRWLPGPVAWIAMMVGYAASIFLMLAFADAPVRVYRALVLGAPRFAWTIVRATVRGFSHTIRGTFIHTEHARSLPAAPPATGSDAPR